MLKNCVVTQEEKVKKSFLECLLADEIIYVTKKPNFSGRDNTSHGAMRENKHLIKDYVELMKNVSGSKKIESENISATSILEKEKSKELRKLKNKKQDFKKTEEEKRELYDKMKRSENRFKVLSEIELDIHGYCPENYDPIQYMKDSEQICREHKVKQKVKKFNKKVETGELMKVEEGMCFYTKMVLGDDGKKVKELKGVEGKKDKKKTKKKMTKGKVLKRQTASRSKNRFKDLIKTVDLGKFDEGDIKNVETHCNIMKSNVMDLAKFRNWEKTNYRVNERLVARLVFSNKSVPKICGWGKIEENGGLEKEITMRLERMYKNISK